MIVLYADRWPNGCLVSHTGTQEKIKIFEQLGAIASVDTHARYCQDIVQKKRQEGNTSLLSTFVSISVDNVGFLQQVQKMSSGVHWQLYSS